jgi:ribonuclease P protein 1
MEKLPLDRYLLWGAGGSKSLTLNQVIQILLDIRATGSWDKALQHVPRRKLASAEDVQERSLQEMGKLKQKLKFRSKYY